MARRRPARRQHRRQLRRGAEPSRRAGDDADEVPQELDYPPPDHHDLSNESIFDYGSRAGVWRLQRLFDELDLPVTFFACARALESNPEVAAYIRERNHDVCCHGLQWRSASTLGLDAEQAQLSEAVAIIERLCGTAPIGWYSRAPASPYTRPLLRNIPTFLYDSDSYADDVPFFVNVDERPWLVVPYSFVTNDSKFVANGGFSHPGAFLDYCIRAFDYLWQEGATRPKMVSIGLHPRFIGHPSRTSALREFLEHCLSRDGVWFARRADIARWWLANASPATEAYYTD